MERQLLTVSGPPYEVIQYLPCGGMSKISAATTIDFTSLRWTRLCYDMPLVGAAPAGRDRADESKMGKTLFRRMWVST